MSRSYADEDLDAAVAEGALTAEAVANFRAFVESRRVAPAADDETFRLLTGFNDIFVTIAIAMVLVALAWLGSRSSAGLGAALVASASWPLAEFFTRRRRMALPSLALLASFVAGVGATVLAWAPGDAFADHRGLRVLAAGAAALIAAFVHWRRFHVPITVAVGALAAVGSLLVALIVRSPNNALTLPAMELSGVLIFALALWWDASDPLRRTRRADVAFWLHLAAAPMIVHPLFSLLGLSRLSLLGLYVGADSGAGGFAQPALALAIYFVLALVALIVDRRALMVSALVYLLFAMNALFRSTGALTTSLALSALIVGAGLLLLSAYWAPARRLVLRIAPASWRARLPAS